MQGHLGELLSSILKCLGATSTLRNQLFASSFHSKLSEKFKFKLLYLNYVRVGKGAFK